MDYHSPVKPNDPPAAVRMNPTPIDVVIRQIRLEAPDIHSFELVAASGAPLPPFTAGAHVDLDLPGRLRRSYSLFGDPAGGSWHIAVKREAAGRGATARRRQGPW